MRIPWYIYAPLSLLVTFLTLYLCIRNVDTVTPPNQEAIEKSLEEWRKENPSIRNTTLSDTPTSPPKNQPTPKPAKPQPKPAVAPKPAKPTPVAKIPAISPALHSLMKQNLTTQQLTSYADHMLKNNQPQLARIAYERIIDFTADATDKDRKSASAAIATLLTKTPLWNPDPSIRKKIPINITLNETFIPHAEKISSQLEQLTFDSSDGTLEANIKITSSTAPLSSLNLGERTPHVTFTLQSTSDLDLKIPAALYHSIRNKNNQSQNLTTIPALPKHISPKQAIQTYITRLAWVNAAK